VLYGERIKNCFLAMMITVFQNQSFDKMVVKCIIDKCRNSRGKEENNIDFK
jgi:hypothetical protein